MGSSTKTMYDIPLSLQDVCVDAICHNLDAVFDQYYVDFYCGINIDNNYENIWSSNQKKEDFPKIKKYRFKQKDLFLYNNISEQILIRLGERNVLNDSTISLFTKKNTRLRRVYLRNAALSVQGLSILKEHNVVELDCCGLKMNLNDIISCLSGWSIENLETLNVSKCMLIDPSRYSTVVALSKLKNLRSLNVSHVGFNQHGLRLLCEDLVHLEKLDISCTLIMDLAPIVALKDRLTSLTIFNYTVCMGKNVASSLLQLTNLKYLDLSTEKHPTTPNFEAATVVDEILSYPEAFPNLLGLDLSGKSNIDVKILLNFVRHHQQLVFLGLVLSQACYEDTFSDERHPDFRSGLMVAGTATERQICISLHRYPSRGVYMQKCFYYLFRMTPHFREPRPDIVALVLPGMEAHSSQFGVQMAATACLYNLTKGELSGKLHPTLLARVVDLTLKAMQEFPSHYQLQKNALLTLCSDRILQDVKFDRFRCARLVLESICYFDDASMNRMAVAICSILAAKISTAETSRLGSNPLYMRKLMQLVQTKVDQFQVDITMKFTLSALWNLTDESATTCQVFLEEGGINLFLQVLNTFCDDNTVETKVLGLVNNIAEVAELRPQLLLNAFVQKLYHLLHSPHIDVSYFAAGIVAHLASDGDAAWTVTQITRQEILAELGNVVANWDIPDGEMVAYRSFFPFFPLLKCPMDFPIQLWAVWAIHHVCTKNPKRYCSMLVSEGGPALLRYLIDDEGTHPSIKHFANLVLEALHAEQFS